MRVDFTDDRILKSLKRWVVGTRGLCGIISLFEHVHDFVNVVAWAELRCKRSERCRWQRAVDNLCDTSILGN
jgi:hypothetical protein